jgi:hypothetical protein
MLRQMIAAGRCGTAISSAGGTVSTTLSRVLAWSRPDRGCWSSWPHIGQRWPSRPVATAAEGRLSKRRGRERLLLIWAVGVLAPVCRDSSGCVESSSCLLFLPGGRLTVCELSRDRLEQKPRQRGRASAPSRRTSVRAAAARYRLTGDVVITCPSGRADPDRRSAESKDPIACRSRRSSRACRRARLPSGSQGLAAVGLRVRPAAAG